MTKKEIREKALYWIGAESWDGDQFAPHLDDAIEEARGEMERAAGREWPQPLGDDESPDMPLWAQAAMAEYGAYMMLRDGSPEKRERSAAHYARYHQAVSRIRMKEDERVVFTEI